MDFVSLVNDNLTGKESKKKEVPYDRSSHWPTSASIKKFDGSILGSCNLALYRKWKNVPETNPVTSDSLQKFAWGNLFHSWVTDILSEEHLSGKLKSVENEVPFKIALPNLKYPISGRIDAVINGNIGLEIKSSFGAFFFGKDSGLITCGPKPEYILQALCYLKARPDLEYFVMLFLARDIGFKLQYKIERKGDSVLVKHYDIKEKKEKTKEYPEISFGGIVSRWMALEKCLEKNEEPAPDWVRHKSSYPCSWCNYMTMCYPDKKATAILPKYDKGQGEG